MIETVIKSDRESENESESKSEQNDSGVRLRWSEAVKGRRSRCG